MNDTGERNFSRRDFVQGAVPGVALAIVASARLAAGATAGDKAAVLEQKSKMHDVNVRRLPDWIAVASIAAEKHGLGHGSGAHAPNEHYLIDSTHPKVQGADGAVSSFVEFLYAPAG